MSALITKHTGAGHAYLIEVAREREEERLAEGRARSWRRHLKVASFILAAILGYIWVVSAIFSIATLID